MSSLVYVAYTLAGFLFIVTLCLLRIYWDSQPHPHLDSETFRNTSLNASPRRGLAAFRRRGLRYRTFSDDEDDAKEDDKLANVKEYRLVQSRPVPEGIKGCLKRADSPSTGTGTGTESDDSSVSVRRKTVRLVEPKSKAALTALREFWAAPGVAGGGASGGAGGGIAGYRRTRDVYVSGQGGTAKIKQVVRIVGEDAGDKDGGEEEGGGAGAGGGSSSSELENDDDDDRLPRRSSRQSRERENWVASVDCEEEEAAWSGRRRVTSPVVSVTDGGQANDAKVD
ncbi:hypothetical protein MNV49_003692 [Pseudohyphozyma bogoriensis]|nr:hypothetical protein MNV49_003692 [Pseudohyphozyma bogoriensis]